MEGSSDIKSVTPLTLIYTVAYTYFTLSALLEPALDAGKVERMKVIDLRRLCGTMKLSQNGKKVSFLFFLVICFNAF